MAKKATAAGDKLKAKKTKSAKAPKSAKASSTPKGGKKPKKSKPSAKSTGAADVIFKLAEHPIVAELIAVGATAAVAAIAKTASDKSGRGNTRAVKDAGKAAAAAIGARLVDEFRAVKQSAEAAKKKS